MVRPVCLLTAPSCRRATGLSVNEMAPATIQRGLQSRYGSIRCSIVNYWSFSISGRTNSEAVSGCRTPHASVSIAVPIHAAPGYQGPDSLLTRQLPRMRHPEQRPVAQGQTPPGEMTAQFRHGSESQFTVGNAIDNFDRRHFHTY
jgi:hypothetical protein